MLLPSPWQEIVDWSAIVLAVPVWIAAGWLGNKAKNAWLNAMKSNQEHNRAA